MDYVALNTRQSHAEQDTFTRARYRQMSGVLEGTGLRVLDVGCATGRGGAALKAARPDITIIGLDCIQGRLDALPADAYEGSICSSSCSIGAQNSSFDAIVAGEFIEHLTYRDALVTLDEFHRVLKPEGTLVMTTPYPNYLRNLVRDRTTAVGAHLSAHYPKQLRVMMRDAGFGDIRFRGSGNMTRLIGQRLPVMSLYGSFMIWGRALAGAPSAASASG